MPLSIGKKQSWLIAYFVCSLRSELNSMGVQYIAWTECGSSSTGGMICAVQVLDRVRGGCAVALVSDAGVPAVSDPGAKLVAAAVANGLSVIPVPGEPELPSM